MSIRQIENGDFEFYYTITDDGIWWSCSCPDFNQPSHREGYKCKHIKDTIKQFKLENIESANKEKVPKEPVDEDVVPF